MNRILILRHKKIYSLVKYFDGNFSTFLEADVLLNEVLLSFYQEYQVKEISLG